MAATITTIILMIIGTLYAAFGIYVLFFSDDDDKPRKDSKAKHENHVHHHP
jgi:flagellar basal body-associated protein FliL